MGELLAVLELSFTNSFSRLIHFISAIAYFKQAFDSYDNLGHSSKSATVTMYATDSFEFRAVYFACLISGRKLSIIDATSIHSLEALRIININQDILVLSNDLLDAHYKSIINDKWAILAAHIILIDGKNKICEYETLTYEGIRDLFSCKRLTDFNIIDVYHESTVKLNETIRSSYTYASLWHEFMFHKKHIKDIDLDNDFTYMSHLLSVKHHVLTILHNFVIFEICNKESRREANYLLTSVQLVIMPASRLDQLFKKAKLALLESFWFKVIYYIWPNSNYVLNRLKRAFLGMFSKDVKQIVAVGCYHNYQLYDIITKFKLPIDVLLYDDNKTRLKYIANDEKVYSFGENGVFSSHEVMYYSQIEESLNELNLVEDCKIIKYQNEVILLVKPTETDLPEWKKEDILKVIEYYVKEVNSNIHVFDVITRIVISPITFPVDSEGNHKQHIDNMVCA